MAVLNSTESYATETVVTQLRNSGNTARITALLALIQRFESLFHELDLF
jgi:hypothetical protein